MEKEERLIKQIKKIYTVIVIKMIDPTFTFPEGGKVNRQLLQFISDFSKTCGGTLNSSRMIDYCVFQIHKNRNAQFQRSLAPNALGKTALNKYKELSSKNKSYAEDIWLSENQLTRAYLNSLIIKKEHPQSKYIYMPSEEGTKERGINTKAGFLICSISTLMWSPFSEACQQCNNAEMCKKETEKKYPELYRIRVEKYGETR